MHIHTIDDENGDVIDAVNLCSDACNRQWCADHNATYGGWAGCEETERTDYCASCGVVLPGFDTDDDGQPCECQSDNIVVNRFLTDDGEKCEHGNWIQLPTNYLN